MYFTTDRLVPSLSGRSITREHRAIVINQINPDGGTFPIILAAYSSASLFYFGAGHSQYSAIKPRKVGSLAHHAERRQQHRFHFGLFTGLVLGLTSRSDIQT